MESGTRVMLTTKSYGTVLSCTDDGLCTVQWGSGVVEQIHESELEEAPPGLVDDRAPLEETRWPGE